MSQQLKTGVIIEGDESGAVRAYASAGKAADGFNAKVALGSEDARKAYQRLVEAIEPYRRQLRVLDEQQEQLRAHLKAGTADQRSYASAMATISRERKQLEDTLQHGGAGIKTFTGLLSEGKDEALALGRSLSEGNFREAGSSLSGLARAGTEALKSLGPMGAAAVAAAAGIGALVAVSYRAEQEQTAFANALKLTNNAAGITATSFEALVQQVGESTGRFGEARETMLSLVQTGRFSGAALASTAEAIHVVAEASGRTTDEVTADFANMASGVAAWAQQHNQAYHFINADQLQHIADLEREGKSQQAVTEVTKLLTDRIQAQGSALGVWGQTAKFWTDLMSEAVDKVTNKFKAPTLDDEIDVAKHNLKLLESQRFNLLNGFDGDVKRFNAAVQHAKNAVTALEQEKQRINDRATQQATASGVDTSLAGITLATDGQLQSLKQQNALFGQGQAAAVKYAMGLDLAKAAGIALDGERQRYIEGVKAAYAPQIAEAAALDAKTKAMQAARTSMSGLIKAQADAAIAQAQSNQQLAETALKAEMQSGLLAYRDYYAQLATLEDEAYTKTAAARAQEASALQAEMTRLQSLGIRAPQGAVQSTRAELQQLLAGNDKLLAEHSAKLDAYGRDLADALHGTVAAVDPAIAALDQYQQNLTRAEQAEAAGVITKRQLALYTQQQSLALQESIEPGAALIRQLELENQAIANGIPVEQARLALKMQQAGASDAEIAATMERVRALTEEKKILQDIFGDQSDPTAEMRKGFEDLRNTIVDVSSTWGRAAATMVSGAENIAKANRFAGEAGKLSGDAQEKAWLESTKAGLEGYAQLASGAAGFFDKGSKGYKTLMAASEAFHAAEIALELAGLVPKATGAILTQGEGDPYSAFGRMAAMAAIVAALGVSVGWGGGGGDFAKPNTGIGAGKGTVLGDSDATSQSIDNSLDALVDLQDKGLFVAQSQLDALRAIEAGINGVGNLLYRTNAPSGGPTPFNMPAQNDQVLGSFLGHVADGKYDILNNVTRKLFGGEGTFGLGSLDIGTPLLSKIVGGILGSTKTKQIDAGLFIAEGQTLGDILAGGLEASYYATIKITKKKLFGLSKSSKTRDEFADLGDELSNQFTDIISGLGDSVIDAAALLGADAQKATDLLNAQAIDIGKISLDGLSSEDVQDKLNAVFSALGDTFAATVLPGISDFQRTGEGLYETLIRVASETSAVQHVFDAMGVAAGDLDGLDLARVADNIIQLSGGIDQFGSNVSDFLDGFLSDSEKLTLQGGQLREQLAGLGYSFPNTSDQFKALVQGLDLTTDAGQATYAALLALSGQAAAFYDTVESNYQDFVDGFLSDDARLAYEGSQLSAQLGALGVALPGTREGFADIVQGIDRTTESGEALYEALLALAGQADSYYQDVEDAVTQEQQAAQQTQQDAAQAAAEATAQWRNLAKSLYDFADGLLEKLLPATAATTANLQRQYDALVARARNGDAAALNQLPSAGNALAEQLLKTAGSRAEYEIELARIRSDALLGADAADARATAEQQAIRYLAAQLAAETQNVTATNDVVNAVAMLAEATGGYAAAQQAVADGLTARTEDLYSQLADIHDQLEGSSSTTTEIVSGGAPYLASAAPATTDANEYATTADIATLRTAVETVATYSAQTAKILKRVTRDGTTLATTPVIA